MGFGKPKTSFQTYSNELKKYKTSDLYFSAYLKTAGVRFLGTEKEGSKVYFLFEKTDMIRDLKREISIGLRKYLR